MTHRLPCFTMLTLLLAVSAPPVAAQAKPAAAARKMVTIQADCVLLKEEDLENFRFHFDLVPLSVAAQRPADAAPQEQPSLEYARGYPTTLLHQALSRQTPVAAITRRRFAVSAVSTPDDIPITISVDADVPDFGYPVFVQGVPGFLPQVERLLRVRGSLTLIPHVNADRSITLRYGLPSGFTMQSDPKARSIPLPPVAGGAALVIGGLHYPQAEGVLLGLSSSALLRLRSWVLLIFLTPSVTAAP